MKTYWIFFIACMITVSIFNTSCQKQTDYSPQIDSLQASLLSLQKRCDSLAIALNIANLNLQTTNTNVDNQTKLIATLQTQIVSILSQIVALTSQLNSTNADVTYILSQITNLNDQYTSLTTQINLILIKLGMLPTSLKSGLVAWYPFSGNANDESGNNHNGTVNGAILTTDRFGNANSSYNFSGSTNDITLSNSQNLVNGSFSVSAWCTIDVLSPSNYDAVLIGQFNGQIANDRKWFFGYRSISLERGISYYLFDNSGNNIFLPKPWTLNWNTQIATWYHIAWVFTSGNSIRTYVNGVLNSNVPLILTNYNSLVNNVLTKIGNGIDIDSPAKLPWNGKIDDVGIWNRALTQQEVSLLTGTN